MQISLVVGESELFVYVLITPVKDEEKNLHEVIESVISQTVKPVLWLIIDDGSTDNSPKIIHSFVSKHAWIKTIRLPPHPRDIIFHVSYVYKSGFDFIVKYCGRHKIQYSFIASMDADTVLEKEYFEKILHKFESSNKLGIASGGLYHEIDGKLKLSGQAENFPSGTGRVWSKECFFDTDGFSLEPSADSISNIKAIMRGWQIQRFNEIQMVEKRLTGSAEGLWKGYKYNGYMAYYLNKNPILILLNVFNYTLKKPHYTGIAFLLGYIRPFIKREERIKDREIREYYWTSRLVEYKNLVIGRLKSLVSTT
ncbi:glycosyltransferase family 2 protein [Methanosarcina sp. 1.H.A.2.2]|uniref:glycosyltransferase family 2 protein n=1 Tax=Methanosarcina sp. 1.H.A.2.2 TaxID=1483601 RepID=UPI0006220FD7|nr:glycosyltransferase family 2 protein [Methanosarcina sp. 1.H.A.2.2]KKH48773.1 glycosyl transferase family A [Methanosarcina sp. 1.H.A.2.2]